MDEICLLRSGITKSCLICGQNLKKQGLLLTDHPRPEVTHVLLDVPSFLSSGKLRGGGDLEALLSMVPETVTVIGGMLNHPALEGLRKIDLLRDETYLAKNAAITADCAIRLAAPLLTAAFRDSPALILGWGRIGKCLAQLLNALGCDVTVAARKEADRAMLEALGYRAVDFTEAEAILPERKLIFNTVPQKVLTRELPAGCIPIDLASTPGLFGDSVIYARGLPGLHAPDSAGRLMAETILNYQKEGIL